MPEADVKELSEAILSVKEKVKYCQICGNFCEEDICSICRDEGRDKAPCA